MRCMAMLLLGASLPAEAATWTIPGERLHLKAKLPEVEGRPRKLKFAGRERPTTVGPLPGDPDVYGAYLRIRLFGATPTVQNFFLPPGPAWTVLESPSYRAFRFENLAGGADTNPTLPVTKVRIKRSVSGSGIAKVWLKGQIASRAGLGVATLALLPPNPGAGGRVTLTVNGGDTYCLGFGPDANGVDAGGCIDDNTANEFDVHDCDQSPPQAFGCGGPSQPPPDACCPSRRITVTTTTEGVASGAGFGLYTIPIGSELVFDVKEAGDFPTCRHQVVVPEGGFEIPALGASGFCARMTPVGCATGDGIGRGDLWDGVAPSGSAHTTIRKVADTADRRCDQGASCEANDVGRIDTTRLPGPGDGMRFTFAVPMRVHVWVDEECSESSSPECCAQADFGDDAADLLFSKFDLVQEFTTGRATGRFQDADGDGCALAGVGFDGGDPDGPVSLDGTPAPGPCCEVGQFVTVVAVGQVFGGPADVGDLGYEVAVTGVVTRCSREGGSRCGLVTQDPCLGVGPVTAPEVLCPGQTSAMTGCFGDPECDAIEVRGEPAIGVAADGGDVAMRLASVWCIPQTGNALLDGHFDLPGPGALTLPGTIRVDGSTSEVTFTTTPPAGTCGETGAGSWPPIPLDCGAIYLGGGQSMSPEARMAAGASLRFAAACAGDECALTSTTADSEATSCSSSGCPFGPHLGLSNGGLSTCVALRLNQDLTGTLALNAGDLSVDVDLDYESTLTGNALSPCPRCEVNGAPGPGSGVCPTGADNEGEACVGINADGDTYECVPSGFVLPTLPLAASPMSTGTHTLP